MATTADDALLAGVAAGDRDAFVALVRRHQSRVFGAALAIVGDRAAAEDVAQEVFVRAWRHAPLFDARRGSALGWLLVITRNLAIDSVRLRRSEPVDPDVLVAAEPAATGTDPVDAALADDDAGRLRAALLALPVDQRRAVLLAGIYGRTAREVGEHEGVPTGTAKTRIRTGLLKLRDALAFDEDPR